MMSDMDHRYKMNTDRHSAVLTNSCYFDITSTLFILPGTYTFCAFRW